MELPPGSSLVGFGSPSEYDPKRLRQPLRAAAAFVRFRAPTAFSDMGTLACILANTGRLRRFDVLDGVAPASYARLLGHPLLGFTLGSFSLSLGPGSLSRPEREPCRMSTNLSVRPRPLPTYRFRMCNPSNKFAAIHIRFGFWALLPLRIRQSPAGVTPRAIRCSSGFDLSRDFALPAPNPSSRACHSRTYATDHRPARCPSAVFPAGRSAFPRFGP
jgi:hypothetical protein